MEKLWRPENKLVIPNVARLVLDDPEQIIFQMRQWEQWERNGGFEGGPPPIGGGAAGTWLFPYNALTNILDGDFDESDTHKMALHLSTGTQPGTGTTTWAGLATSEHAAANGYTAGGIAIDLTLAGAANVKTIDIATDPVWTASGGSIVARWAAIYEVGADVICYCLLESTGPADVTATDGNSLTVAAHASGVFTLTGP